MEKDVASISNQVLEFYAPKRASARSREAQTMPMSAFLKSVAILLVVAAIGGCSPATVSDEERGIVLTAPELQSYGFTSPIGAIDETWDGWRWFDGSREIDYTYQTLNESEQMPLYLSVNIGWETTHSDAVATYGATLLGFKVGSATESIERQQLTDSCEYGDRCTLFLLTRDQRPLGNQFVLQVGRTVYTVQLFGLYFDEPEVWHEVIVPKVAALKRLGKKES
jgi:hypothetical protein